MPSEDRNELIESYAKLQKKHNFPQLEEFEGEFGFRVQFPITHSMLSIIQDKMWQIGGHIETIITPQRLVDYIESGFYKEKEHEEFYAFYKELMAIWHESGLSRWQSDEERAAAIKVLLEFHDKKMKPFALKFLEDQTRRWKDEMKKKEKPSKHQSYHQ